jgi:two-component system sensor histidine kinase/response regulator
MSLKDNGAMKRHHILLVEDDRALLTGMSDLLVMAGYEVSSAMDGADALKLLGKMPSHPDLIVSDIRMPNMDGYQLLAEVKERPEWLSIPFIFLTAKGEKEDVRDGKLRGVDDYLIKPFEFQDLLVSIQSCLSRREQLDALQESRFDALRHRILTIINHEFRTPISLILAYADLLEQSPSFKHSSELRQYVSGIVDGSERLWFLIESFLTLAELESGYGTKMYERRKEEITDLEELVQGVIKSLQVRVDNAGVDLKLVVEGALPTLEGERNYLRITLRHLIDNAIKFSPPGKKMPVTVKVEADDRYLTFAVSDKGQGIPPDEQPMLFSAFHQVNRDEYEQQGAGVGLAIAEHVAQLHGGHIEVESEVGEGSCFRLFIPVTAPDRDTKRVNTTD